MPEAVMVAALLILHVSQSIPARQCAVEQDVLQQRTTCTDARWSVGGDARGSWLHKRHRDRVGEGACKVHYRNRKNSGPAASGRKTRWGGGGEERKCTSRLVVQYKSGCGRNVGSGKTAEKGARMWLDCAAHEAKQLWG
jgi:hypothetical protein